jgi:hypothetical protein
MRYDPNKEYHCMMSDFEGANNTFEDTSISKNLKSGYYICYTYHDIPHSTKKDETEYFVKFDCGSKFKVRKSKMDEIDEVEFADSTDSYEHGSFTFKKKESNVKLTNNKAYRKAYKHKVKTKRKKNMESNKSFSDVSYMLPNELSSKLIVSDKEKAMNITKSYEKARYSKEEVTKEEIKYLKSL